MSTTKKIIESKESSKSGDSEIMGSSETASVLQVLQYLHPAKKEKESDHERALEEFSCRQSDKRLNLSLLISPNHSCMRVVDYRLGQYKLKCNIFDQLASTKQLKKVFTLVEKQDSNSWRTVGFSKEAVIPAYFRNADGYLMSRVYDNNGAPVTGGLAKMVREKGVDFNEPVILSKKPKGLKLKIIDDPFKIHSIIKSKDTHYSYNPFGKGVYHPKLIIEAKVGGKYLWVGGEINDAFGHAKVDILKIPSNTKERKFMAWMLHQLLNELSEDHDVASVFGFSFINDVAIGQVFVDAGFKSTGQLTKHMKTEDGKSSDVFIWHKKVQSESDAAMNNQFAPV